MSMVEQRKIFVFDDKEPFLTKVRQLSEEGHDEKSLQIRIPFPMPEVEKLLEMKPGGLRFFAIFGALSGFLGGLAFTIYTALFMAHYYRREAHPLPAPLSFSRLYSHNSFRLPGILCRVPTAIPAPRPRKVH